MTDDSHKFLVAMAKEVRSSICILSTEDAVMQAKLERKIQAILEQLEKESPPPQPVVVWHVADGKCQELGCEQEFRVGIQRCGKRR